MNGTANNQGKLNFTRKLCAVSTPQMEATRILASSGHTACYMRLRTARWPRTHRLCLNPRIHKQLILELGTEHKAPSRMQSSSSELQLQLPNNVCTIVQALPEDSDRPVYWKLAPKGTAPPLQDSAFYPTVPMSQKKNSLGPDAS